MDEEGRAVFIHCGLEGMTAADAAPLVSATAEAVDKRWYRLRKKLEAVSAWRNLFDLTW